MMPGDIGSKSQFGPYYIYGPAADLRKIVEANPVFNLEGPEPEKITYTLEAKFVDFNDTDAVSGSAQRKFARNYEGTMKKPSNPQFSQFGSNPFIFL